MTQPKKFGEEPEVSYEKNKTITIGGIPIPVYMMPNGEYRLSMRQASKAVGFNEGWLSETLRKSNALDRLKGYGFKGGYEFQQEQGFIESYLISTEDFMAVIMYAVLVGYHRPAISLMAAAMQETLEHRADHAFGVVRDNEAVERLIKDYQRQNRYLLIQQAKGIWADREDIPDVQQLRQEWQRL
jgi:hypothetical protein